MSRWLIAQTEGGGRSLATLNLVSAALERQGRATTPVSLPASGLPAGVEPIEFKDTPPEVAESWRVARHLEAASLPGDVVVISDRDAIGAVFALEQAAVNPADRRLVLLIGADGPLLTSLARTNTAGEGRLPHWERAAFSLASGILTTSEWATAHLEPLGPPVFLLPEGTPRRTPVVTSPPARVWLPEPVSRTSQTGAILRALAGIDGVDVVVGETDVEDELWNGTTWEALAGIRRLLSGRLERDDAPASVDVVILGDRTLVPSEDLRRRRDQDARFIVAAGSAAAALWPEADVWTTEDDLARALLGTPAAARSHRAMVVEPAVGQGDDTRAQRVSVGVPVFGSVEYLDECLTSIVDQTLPPAEILIYDDGSMSEEVTGTLEQWRAKHPGLITLMSGPNRGVCVARNNMLEQMTGDAFVLVDSDDRLAPGFIEECAGALRANPAWSAVATWTGFFGDYTGVEAKPPFDPRSAWDENPIVSTCVLVDMSVRDAGIRFSPDLAFIFCEDWEFWAHMVGEGFAFGLVPKPLAFHRADPLSGGGYKRTKMAYGAGRERARHHLRRVTP